MNPFELHALFDVLAWISAALTGLVISRWRPLSFPVAANQKLSYFAALLFGSAASAYVCGTWNLWASGQTGVSRSIEGAIFGGVAAIEIYKWMNGIAARTGARFAGPLAAGIAVGRIGCFLAGLPDFTYGTPTDLPFGVDFGDGLMRHPVQLYESAAMALFAGLYIAALARNIAFIASNGLYLAILFYGLQRFAWEFIKPYGPLLGPFTLFHFLSLALALYAARMLITAEPAADERTAS